MPLAVITPSELLVPMTWTVWPTCKRDSKTVVTVATLVELVAVTATRSPLDSTTVKAPSLKELTVP
jgi:hypothetical protein